MTTQLPKDTQRILDLLQSVATKTIERKRRLGHYVVVWENDQPIARGEDAPSDGRKSEGG